MSSIPCGRRGKWGGSGGGRNPEEAPPASSEEVGELLAPSSPLLMSQPGMLPQSSPMSSLAPFFQETSPDHVLPLLLGNSRSPCAPSMESSFCHLVSGLGARDPSPQIDSILSRAQPSIHIPETQCSGGSTQAQGTSPLPMPQLGVLCLQHQGCAAEEILTAESGAPALPSRTEFH